jgi:cytochrome o ubiquinol oxidase subunit IV
VSTENPLHAAPDFQAGSYVGEDRPSGLGPQAPESNLAAEVRGYLLGLGISIILTAATFWAAGTHLIYGPGIVMAVVVLAIAQMGIHLVFFLHITTAPDNTNNVLALAFGILVAGLIIFGSLWVMAHLNHNMMPMQNAADMGG